MPLRTSKWRTLHNASFGVGVLGFLVAATASADEPPAMWQVVPRAEHSEVKVNGHDGQWDAWSVALARATGPGRQIRATIGREERNGISDDELQLSADGRVGQWNTGASFQLSPDPVFLPRWGYQLQADHTIGRNRRAGAGYRHLQFNDSSVDLLSTYMTFYRGDDELGIEYRFGRNAMLDHDIRVLQLRASVLRAKNRFGLYLARGRYLFDALDIPGGRGDGWSANVSYTRAIAPSTALRWELGTGREANTFLQRSIGVSVQFSP